MTEHMMKAQTMTRRIWMAAILVLAGLGAFLPPAAQATQMQTLYEDVPVISGVMIYENEAKQGMDFHATLAEPISYRNRELPDGTQFIGHLRAPKNIAWSNRWEVWVDQVVFPNGKTFKISDKQGRQTPNTSLVPVNQVDGTRRLIPAGGQLNIRFAPADLKGMLRAGGYRASSTLSE